MLNISPVLWPSSRASGIDMKFQPWYSGRYMSGMGVGVVVGMVVGMVVCGEVVGTVVNGVVVGILVVGMVVGPVVGGTTNARSRFRLPLEKTDVCSD